MWRNKHCPCCAEKVGKDWKYCPHCGTQLHRPMDIFEEVEEAFKEFDKFFSPRFFKFPSFPFRGGGISITITSKSGEEPKVQVSTFGDYKLFEPEIKQRLGVKPKVKEVEMEEAKAPAVTEEPEMVVEQLNGKQVLKLKLPGVRSVEEVDVRKLEQSIEVRARVGNKAYFKLIPIKPDAEILDKRYKKETLELEIG